MTKKKNINKKNKKIVDSSNIVENDELRKLIYIVIGAALVFTLFYGMTYLINKNRKNETKIVPATIQYDEIIIGQLLTRNEDEYYVLITSKDDQYNNLYSYYKINYETKENSIKIYTSNLDDIFNKKYISETSNIKVSAVDELRLSGTTLIKVKNHSIESYYEGKDAISAHFDELIG